MTRIAHVHRRGAMYIWRKRCPVASCLVGVTLCLSLQTREASTAAYRAAITTHQFYLMFASMTGKMITRAEAQSYSEAVLDAELARIEGERWSEADDLSPDEWRNLWSSERTKAAGLRIVAWRGMGASLLSEDMYCLRERGFVPPEMGETTRAILMAQDPLAARDFEGVSPFPEEHFPDRMLTDGDLACLRRQAMTERAEAVERHDRFAPAVPDRDIDTSSERAPVSADIAPSAPAPTSRFDPGILSIEARRTDREGRQRKQTSDVEDIAKSFEKEATRRVKVLAQFVELVGKSRLTDLKQDDLAYYRDCLLRIPKSYNKSPADRDLPMGRILERGDSLPPHEGGLSANTVNRNLAILGRILDQGQSEGLIPAAPLNLKTLRVRAGLRRDARLEFSSQDIAKIFAHPTWHGRHSEKRMQRPGREIVRDALYWMPLLAVYTGARREELVGLKIEDIGTEAKISHIYIRPNGNRSLKNPQPERIVPLHPHLVALGIASYVQNLRAQAKADLFPDLRPGNVETASFGDALHYRWPQVLGTALGSDARKKTFHSFRHAVSSFLQNETDVRPIVVKDIFGNLAGDITSDTYRDVSRLAAKREVIAMLPRVF